MMNITVFEIFDNAEDYFQIFTAFEMFNNAVDYI